MNEFEIAVKDGEIVITAGVANLLEQAQLLNKTIKDLTAKRDAITEALKWAMSDNGIESFKSQYVNVSHVKASMTETVNVEKLKMDGLYEKYRMYIPKNGSYRVTFKKEKDNG